MPVLKPRNRLVNFRLSDDEYESLKAACALQGARSVSDFARDAVLRSAAIQDRQDPPMQKRLIALGLKVSELEAHVRDLLQLVKGSEGESGSRGR